MRAVIQKVSHAHVEVVHHTNTERVGSIQQGLMILLGVSHDDTLADVHYLADKIAHLRIFEDEQGKLNLSIKDIQGSILLVSQFTLYADARTGRRPSFSAAAKPEHANQLYEQLVQALHAHHIEVQTGRFQTHMQVHLCNDGPVTLLLDSKKLF